MDSDEEVIFEYNAELLRIIDGDTLVLNLDLGFGLTRETEVRLLDVDTAEVYGVSESSSEYQLGKEHEQYVAEWLTQATSLTVRTKEKGSFGRWLAEVENEDGDVLNNELIERFDVQYK